MFSARNINTYNALCKNATLVLDGQTLINLEILVNHADGSSKGTLLKLLNHCATPFGKRLFKKWLCYPLQSVAEINKRLDAVDDLYRVGGAAGKKPTL